MMCAVKRMEGIASAASSSSGAGATRPRATRRRRARCSTAPGSGGRYDQHRPAQMRRGGARGGSAPAAAM